MNAGRDRKTRRRVGHLERWRRHARISTPRNHAFLRAALLTLLVVSCSASEDVEGEPQTSQPSEQPADTSTVGTTTSAEDETTNGSESVPERPCIVNRIDSDTVIQWIPENCLFQPPYEGWHPTLDEEHEWVLGWRQLPAPGLDERGRVNQAGCSEDSPRLDLCFSICRGGLDLMGEDSPGLWEGEMGPCQECEDRYDIGWGIWYGHGQSGASPGPTACGAYARAWNCGYTIDEQFETIPRPHWEHLYVEWDDTTSPPSVAGCWYRLPGPYFESYGHYRFGSDRSYLDEVYYPNLERAREQASESGEGSEEGEPDDASDSNGQNEDSQPPDP